MSFFEFCEQALRGVAFLTQIITFVILHILEMSFRPLYYPLFGAALKKFLGHEPVDFLTFAFAKTFMKVIEVKIIPVNLTPLLNKEVQPCILMYTHGSNLDPVALQNVTPFKLHYVAKKQLFQIPLLGRALRAMGAIPIDRGNLEKAKESLSKAAEYINSKKKSVCIAPEGTRRRKNSDTKPRIAPFKKGPFHLAKACNVNIQPVIVTGAFRLWPPGYPFVKPGNVYIHYLPIYSKEKVEKLSVEDLLADVQKEFDKGLEEINQGKQLPFNRTDKEYGCFIFFLALTIFSLFCSYKFLRVFI